MNHLDRLENTTVHILREAYANFKNLGMLWSIGKDSTALLWLARKAFFGHVPITLVHIDTSFKIPEMIAYRDRLVKEWKLNLVYGINEKALKDKETFPDGKLDRIACCKVLKTDALVNTINGNMDALSFQPRDGQLRAGAEPRAIRWHHRWHPGRRGGIALEGAIFLRPQPDKHVGNRGAAAGVLESVQDGIRAGHARPYPSASRLDRAEHLGVHTARKDPNGLLILQSRRW